MNLLFVPLHIYSLPEEHKKPHSGLIARVYLRAAESRFNYEFFSVSHTDGLTRAVLTPDTAPKSLPEALIGPLAGLINRQLEDLIEKKGEIIDAGYLFIRRDAGHYIIRKAIQRVFEQMAVPLKIYTSSELTRATESMG